MTPGAVEQNAAEGRHLALLQINLHHAKAASAVLSERFMRSNLDVVLIQEPWVNRGAVRGLPSQQCKVLYCQEVESPRAAILLKNGVNFSPVSEFITRDLVAVEVEVLTEGGKQEAICASAYFPDVSDEPPPEEVVRLINHCKAKNKQFIIGCDANAHHTVWGSRDINKRGEYLLQYLVANNITILNRGSEPTFVNAVRQEVIDLTLASSFISTKVTNWHVSQEASLSDHRQIRFDLEAMNTAQHVFRVPKLTDWEAYRGQLKSELEGIGSNIESIHDLNLAASLLKETIISSYERCCPIKHKKANRDVPWWNRELGLLRAEARRQFNRAKRSGEWSEYRAILTAYNKELRKSKRRSWRSFCEGIEQLPTAVRLQKVLSKEHSNGMGHLQKPDGSYTESREETVRVLLQTHFPDSVVVEEGDSESDEVQAIPKPANRVMSLSGRIFTPNRIRWAVGSFKPYKSPGRDGIFPALLKEGLEELLPSLVKIFRASYAWGFIPLVWRDVNVVFIPKAGRRPAAQPKSYRPISLTSFLLKAMEKVLDQFLRNETLTRSPLHEDQFAYQKGKSTVTALHCLVGKLEGSIRTKDIALCGFLDIEGAFDNASFSSIERAAVRKGFEPSTIKWILSMLQCRRISASLGGHSVTVKAIKGCPQGGVISPLLWSILVDDLLVSMNSAGYEVQGYADDIVIIVRGKFEGTVVNRMQSALNHVSNWCQKEDLSVNPGKTIIVPFTKRRLNLGALTLNGTVIPYSREVKYLGVVLDQKLTWNTHINRTVEKALMATWTCQRLFGKTWGLQPKMILWTYLTVIRPMVNYASLVWWPKTLQKTAQTKLQKVQRLACLGVTGAMRTCPTAAMEAMLDLLPLHLHVKKEAAQSAFLVQRVYAYKPGNLAGHLRILNEFEQFQVHFKVTDIMLKTFNFERSFEVAINSRQSWQSGAPSLERGALIWYTDGSRMDGRVGIGVKGPNFSLAKALGTSPTIFQAETHAIQVCALENLEKGLRGARIYIMSDSQAALKALSNHTFESKLVLDCFNALNELGSRNKVTLMWVPGHEGIEGNEIADRLAKEGAESQFIGPEPFCGTNRSHVKSALRLWEDRTKSSIWEMLPGLRQSKKFLTFSSRRTKSLLLLNKQDLRLLTGLLTGHCPLRYHLKKMGTIEDDNCRLCLEHEETAEHILCSCEAIAYQRLCYWGKALLEPRDIQQAAPRKILGFVKSLRIDWET